ncbi:MAG: septum formation initiator family protein [Patescibacteria group bacterium]
MEDFRHKQKMRRIMYSKTLFGVLAALLLLVIWKTWDIYQKQRLAAQALEESRVEYEELAERAQVLSEDLDTLNTPAGVEEVVRDRYGVAKPGEEVIILINDVSAQKESEDDEVGFWAKLKAFFTE